jgi:hypothetical protein
MYLIFKVAKKRYHKLMFFNRYVALFVTYINNNFYYYNNSKYLAKLGGILAKVIMNVCMAAFLGTKLHYGR